MEPGGGPIGTSLIVFYKLEPGSETVTWKYDWMPRDWRYTGTVRVTSDNTAKYTHRAGFAGSRQVLYDMIDYLKGYFENLFDLGFLRRYKIADAAAC